ncbi:hypothetical protein [Candidatus Methylocalor cossyra]|uniref:Uncharacterized protein n=1 Tax=Candidatus Methylocalor cossyra TaxID=3108543 RepID=A0ABM9NE05_9GAMM
MPAATRLRLTLATLLTLHGAITAAEDSHRRRLVDFAGRTVELPAFARSPRWKYQRLIAPPQAGYPPAQGLDDAPQLETLHRSAFSTSTAWPRSSATSPRRSYRIRWSGCPSK